MNETTNKIPTVARSLQGRVALVAGASRNLGRQVALELAAAGADVLLHYNSASSAADAEAAVHELRGLGVRAEALQGDLSEVSQIERIFAEGKTAFGRIDIAVNAVGRVLKKPLIETSEAEFDAMFAVNSRAAFFFIREAGRQLEDGGKIISIATSLLAAFTGGYSVYAGAKAPLEHFTRAAAKELAARGISVNAVAPGPLDTPFFHGQENAASTAYLSAASMNGKLGDVRDIAPIVRFLAGEGWWINGQTLFANGGFTAR